jgi:hypothetical protein
MEAKKVNHKYTEWLSAEEMHDETLRWMSSLHFIKDEQLFLNDLVQMFTLKLLDTPHFDEHQDLITKIATKEKELLVLMKKVQTHENLLEVMVNDVDERAMEKAYVETHKNLSLEFNDYMNHYNILKKGLFDILKEIMAKDKQKRLLN